MNRYPISTNDFSGMLPPSHQQDLTFAATAAANFNQMPFSVPRPGMIPTGMQPTMQNMNMMAQPRPMMTPHHNQNPYGSTMYNAGYWPVRYDQPMKGAESKARFNKEEVEQLEKVFRENNKPSGEHKREIAENLGVEVARINNWFQNRRAKKKQEDKLRDNAPSSSTSSEDKPADSTAHTTILEVFPSSTGDENNSALLRPNAAAFPSDSTTSDSTSTLIKSEHSPKFHDYSVSPTTSMHPVSPPEFIEGLNVHNTTGGSTINCSPKIKSGIALRRNMNMKPVHTAGSGALGTCPRASDISPISRSSSMATGRVQKKSSISASSHSLMSPTHLHSLKFQIPVTPVTTQNAMFASASASVSPMALPPHHAVSVSAAPPSSSSTPSSSAIAPSSSLDSDMSPILMSNYAVSVAPSASSSSLPMLSMSSQLSGPPAQLNMAVTSGSAMTLSPENLFAANPMTPSLSMSAGPFSGTHFDLSSMGGLSDFSFGFGGGDAISPGSAYLMDYSLSSGVRGELLDYSWDMQPQQPHVNVASL